MRHLPSLAAAALVLGACAQEPTRIVVVTDTDLDVPSEIARVRFVIDARGAGGQIDERRLDLWPGSAPIVMSLVHDGGATGPITITAVGEARDDGSGSDFDAVVVRSARVSFVPGRTVVLQLDLLSSCRGRECDRSGETCIDGDCRSAVVDAESLPPWSGRPAPLEPTPMTTPAADASTRPPAIDGGPVAACGPVLGCGDGSCACTTGCCELRCPSGADCEDARCDGESTICEVDARGASNLRLRCEHGATCRVDATDASNVLGIECKSGASCEIDCSGASNCVPRCDSASSCLVECGGASTCGIDCDGLELECAGGVRVCGRACP